MHSSEQSINKDGKRLLYPLTLAYKSDATKSEPRNMHLELRGTPCTDVNEELQQPKIYKCKESKGLIPLAANQTS